MNKGKGPLNKRFGGKRPGAGKPRDKEKEHLQLDKLLHEHNAKTGGNTEIYEKKKEEYMIQEQKKKQDDLNEQLKKFMANQPTEAK